MSLIPHETIEVVRRPNRPSPRQQRINPPRRETFPSLDNRAKLICFIGGNQDMDVVRHDAPRLQCVAFGVVVTQRVSYRTRATLIAQNGASQPLI